MPFCSARKRSLTLVGTNEKKCYNDDDDDDDDDYDDDDDNNKTGLGGRRLGGGREGWRVGQSFRWVGHGRERLSACRC